MARQPFGHEWQGDREKRKVKAVLLTCGVLFAIPFMFMFLAIISAIFFGSDDNVKYNGREVQKVQERLTLTSKPAAEGLDLQAVVGAFQNAPNAEAFEKTLNDPESGLNNLDLNADGKVDFIKVTEYGNAKDVFGYALTTEPEAGQEQEIARIELFKEGKQFDMQVLGNQQVYGPNYGWQTAMNVAQFAMLAYLISETWRPYRSPYRYGYYPSYYRPYSWVNTPSYSRRTQRYRNNVSSLSRVSQPRNMPSGVSRAKSGATATSGIARTLKSPTAGQRSFQNKFQSNLKSQARSTSRSSGSVRGSSGRSAGSGK